MERGSRSQQAEADRLRQDLVERTALKSILTGKRTNLWQLRDAFPHEQRHQLFAAVRKERQRLLELIQGEKFLRLERLVGDTQSCEAPQATALPRSPPRNRTNARRAAARIVRIVDDSDDEEEGNDIPVSNTATMTLKWTQDASGGQARLQLTASASPAPRSSMDSAAQPADGPVETREVVRAHDCALEAVAALRSTADSTTQLVQSVAVVVANMHDAMHVHNEAVQAELADVRREMVTAREERRSWSWLRWWRA